MGGKEEGKKKGEELGFIMTNKINKKMFMSMVRYITSIAATAALPFSRQTPFGIIDVFIGRKHCTLQFLGNCASFPYFLPCSEYGKYLARGSSSIFELHNHAHTFCNDACLFDSLLKLAGALLHRLLRPGSILHTYVTNAIQYDLNAA